MEPTALQIIEALYWELLLAGIESGEYQYSHIEDRVIVTQGD